MNVPESWLRHLVDPSLTADELSHLLTMSGLEVESCAPLAPPFEGVVAARVLEVARHPNADKLSVCKVDAGGQALSIVPEDGPSRLYLERCRKMAAEPPGREWDGVTVMETK